MSATEKLLDKYAETCYATKDIEIATKLKVRKQTVSGWRNGKAHPDADSVEKMAETIGEPVGPWLARIEAERARTAEAKRVWLRLAATLGTTLAIAMTALPYAIETARSLPIVSNLAKVVANLWDTARSTFREHPHCEPYPACNAAPAQV